MKYTYLEHTADAKFQATGSTLEEAFQQAALATAGLMWDVENIQLAVTQEVEVAGKDLKQLLMGFLEEILFHLDSRHFLLGKVDKLHLDEKGSGFTLRCVFIGDIQSGQYEIFGDVKAITYNEMVIKSNTPCLVQVVVDM